MDIKSLWTKLDQIAEASDLNALAEAKKKKPDADGDGVPDWADKKPGKDDNKDKEKVEESSLNEHGDPWEDPDYDPRGSGRDSRSPEQIAKDRAEHAVLSKKLGLSNKNDKGSVISDMTKMLNHHLSGDAKKKDVEEGEMSSRKGDSGETIRVHKAKAGGYGRKIDKDYDSGDKFHSSDIDDSDDEPSAPTAVKRGRGRPRVGADSDTGEVKKYDTDTLASWIIGNKPKNKNIGKVSHVNRLKEHMQQVETKMIIEGKMGEVDAFLQEIIDGEIDIADIITDKFAPMGAAEEFVAKKLKDKFEEYTRHTQDDGGPDAMDRMYSELEDIISGKDSLEEVAIGGTGAQQQQQQAGQQAGQEQQGAKVMAGGKVVGMVSDPTKVSAATSAANTMTNAQKQLNQTGFKPASAVNESLADTMNKFSAALDAPRKKRQLNESALSKIELVMEGTLEEILQVYPHEHKMCQEGWGMDEAMFEALCDHYHREGKIPRNVWHGPMEELRKHVEECYMQDTQPLMGEAEVEEGMFDKAPPTATLDTADSIPEKSTFNPYNPSATPAKAPAIDMTSDASSEGDDLLRELDEELDKVLNKENTMYEAKKPSAGMSAKEKSSVAKKAHKGGDIGKPGKGFAKVAAKAAKEYGSAEAGKKVAAAAMWKNAAHQSESVEESQLNELSPKTLGSYVKKASKDVDDKSARTQEFKDMFASEFPIYGAKKSVKQKRAAINKRHAGIGKAVDKMTNEASDADQIAHDMTAKKRGIARQKNRAEITSMMSADHPTKASGAKEQKKIGQYNRQLTKPEVVGEAKRTAADNKAEKAGKKVTKDIEWDEKHKVNEGKFGQMDADLADLSPAEFKKEYGMTKAEARAKHGGKKPAPAKKLEEMDNPDRWDDAGKPQYTVKKIITPKKMAKDAGKALNKAFDKATPKKKVKESEYDSRDAYEKHDPKHPDFKKNYEKYKKQHAGATLSDFIASLKKKVKESYDFSEWDQQLTQLIEGKKPAQITEGRSIASRQPRQQLNEEGLADLIAMIKNAGMQPPSAQVAPTRAPAEIEVDIESDPEQNTAAYRDGDAGVYDGTGSPASPSQHAEGDPHSKFDDASDVPVMAMPRGMGMSQNTEDGVESHVVEPVMSDEVIDHLQSGESDDSGDDTLAFIKKTMNHGETPVEVKQTSGDYADEVAEDNYGDTQSAGASATGGSPSAMANKPAKSMEVQEDDELPPSSWNPYNKKAPAASSSTPAPASSAPAPSAPEATERTDNYSSEVMDKIGNKDREAVINNYGINKDPNPYKDHIESGNSMGSWTESEDMEEGNAFSGAVARAKADGIQKGEKIKVGGKEYPVKEGNQPPPAGGEINPNNGDLAADVNGEAAQDNAGAAFDQAQAQSQPMNEEDDEGAHEKIGNMLKKIERILAMHKKSKGSKEKVEEENDNMNMVANRHSELEVNEATEMCEDCGGKMGKGHDCDEQLNEWANTPSQLIDDETFTTDIDFMTKGISGGLNSQKQDQTLVGSGPNRVVTQTERETVGQSMGALLKKLGGLQS